MVFGGLWAALHHPWWFLGALLLFVLAAAWVLPKLWRGLRRLVGALTRPFRSGSGEVEGSAAQRTEVREP